MGKAKENFRKFYKAYIVTFVVSLLIGAGIFCLYFFLNVANVLHALNGVTFSTIALAGLGGLMWVNSQGAFDTLSYGFRQMFASFFAKNANKYNDMYAYKEAKAQKRESSPKTWLAVLIAAAIFALAIIPLEIIYHIH